MWHPAVNIWRHSYHQAQSIPKDKEANMKQHDSTHRLQTSVESEKSAEVFILWANDNPVPLLSNQRFTSVKKSKQ